MSSKTTKSYVILPNNLLKEVLLDFDPFIQTILSSPIVWHLEYYGREEDVEEEAYIKLRFLANLRCGILPGSRKEAEIMNLAEIIFGEPPFHLELFDKWWTISDGTPPGTLAMDLIAPEHFLNTLRQFAVPDNPMAKWWLEQKLTEE